MAQMRAAIASVGLGRAKPDGERTGFTPGGLCLSAHQALREVGAVAQSTPFSTIC